MWLARLCLCVLILSSFSILCSSQLDSWFQEDAEIRHFSLVTLNNYIAYTNETWVLNLYTPFTYEMNITLLAIQIPVVPARGSKSNFRNLLTNSARYTSVREICVNCGQYHFGQIECSDVTMESTARGLYEIGAVPSLRMY